MDPIGTWLDLAADDRSLPAWTYARTAEGFDLIVRGWRWREGAQPSDFSIHFVRRPHYCDRGRWLVYNEAPSLDYSDGWPRYYFNLDVAVSEVCAWLKARHELKSAVSA